MAALQCYPNGVRGGLGHFDVDLLGGASGNTERPHLAFVQCPHHGGAGEFPGLVGQVDLDFCAEPGLAQRVGHLDLQHHHVAYNACLHVHFLDVPTHEAMV